VWDLTGVSTQVRPIEALGVECRRLGENVAEIERRLLDE
jgi:hypothetical protein